MRWILAVIALIVLLVVGGLVYLFTNIDSLVKAAIEDYGSQITGTAVRVDSVEFALAEGRGTVRGITVANPPGFASAEAFSLGEITVDIDPATVTASPIVIDAVTVGAPQVTYELDASLKSNIQTILDNVERYSASGDAGGEGGEDASAEESGEETLLRISRFTFRDGLVAADTRALGGPELDVKLPPLELKNLGGSAGAPPGEIGSQVADAYMNTVVKTVKKKTVGKQVKKLKKKGAKAAQKALEGLLK